MAPDVLRPLTTAAAAALVVASSAGTARAEDQPSWDWNLFGGLVFHDEDASLGNGRRASIANGFLLGVRLSQWIGEVGGVEGEIPVSVTSSTDRSATLLWSMPRLHALVSAWRSPERELFFAAGGGLPLVLSSNRGAVDSDVVGAGYLGVGFRSDVGETLRVRADLRWNIAPALDSHLFASDVELFLTFSRQPRSRGLKVVEKRSDLDGDGVADVDDRCPSDAEDEDGFEDDDGCPELDNDSDGILDGLDRCAEEGENENGYRDGDGCNDEMPEEVRLLEGVITGLRFEPGAAVIENTSLEALDHLYDVLRREPSVQIEIIGHTDNVGDYEENQALSQGRADSVREYLIGRGIGPGRLLATGRGSEDPVASNDTRGGRRANRRVEVRIVVGGIERDRF